MKRNSDSTLLRRIKRGIVRFLREPQAATATEYAFMIAMISLASVAAITAFSDAAIVIFEEVTTTLTGAVGKNL